MSNQPYVKADHLRYLPRLLVLDDEEPIRRMIGIGLDGQFECIEAMTCGAALGIIRANNIALIFMDLGLPDSDGMETLERILPAAGDVPIVVGSGSMNPHNALRALEMGAVDYIHKPYNLTGLAERFTRAIARGRYRAQIRREVATARAEADGLKKEMATLQSQLGHRPTWNRTTVTVAIIQAVAALILGLLALLKP